jgi:cytochrome P450
VSWTEVKKLLFPDDGRILPKGADVLISIADIHRDPESFSKPEEFDPERFSEERTAELNPSAFLPFSMGIRNCIGNSLYENLCHTYYSL